MERKVLEKWIENKEDLYIWGASTASLDMVLSLLRNYEQIDIKGIIDNYSKEKYVNVGTNKFQIIEFDKIAKNSKIILCIIKRSSYASIREQLVSSGMRYGIDYIEVQPVINGAYFDIKVGSDDNPYDDFGFGSRYAPWRKMGVFRKYIASVKVIL